MIFNMPAFCPVLTFCIQVQIDNGCILNDESFGYLRVYVISSCIFKAIFTLSNTCTGHKDSQTEFNITHTPTALEF